MTTTARKKVTATTTTKTVAPASTGQPEATNGTAATAAVTAPTVSAPNAAERQSARIERRNGTHTPSDGSRARQLAHKGKTVRAWGQGAAALGLSELDAFDAYVAPHTLDAAALGRLADAADRARSKMELRSPYFRCRNFARVAFNADAPAFTLGELAPVIRAGIAEGFADVELLNAAK